MRKRMFTVVLPGLLAIAVGGSTYVIAWRDTAVTASGQVNKRIFTATPLAQDPHAAHARAGQELPLVVDGGTTPEGIPDWMAYRHFITIMALPSNAASDAQLRRNAHLDAMGLSGRDRAALLRSLGGTRAKLENIAARRKRWDGDTSPKADGARQALRAEEKATFDDTHRRMRGAMSVEGGTRLSVHLARMKRSIVIRGTTLPQF